MPRYSAKKPLAPSERRLLLLQLQEAEARGIELPEEAKRILDKEKAKWPIAANGYFIRNDGKLYTPSENQGAFVNSNARFSLFYGSRGSGKTAAGAQRALKRIMMGQSGLIMNPDFENLKISTWPELKQWIPWNMVIPSQKHRKSDAWEPHQPFTLVFVNGAKAFIKGGKESSSSRGPNVNWFWYDEGGRDDTGVAWQIANAGVRIGFQPQAWCTETPRPTEHWSYKFFIAKEIPQDAIDEFAKLTDGDRILVDSYHGTIEDNKANLDPGFYASILAAYPSGWLRTQEVEGEFSNEGGKIGDRNWFKDKVLTSAPDNAIKKIRFWDLAATEKKIAKDDPDEAVGSLVSSFPLEADVKQPNGELKKEIQTNFCIEHQVAGYWSWEKLLEAILNTARHDGPYIIVVIEEEPGSGGKNQVAAVQAEFKKYPELIAHKVEGQRARDVGDRVMAAGPWFGLASRGLMWIVKGIWNDKFLSQLDGFTQILHDDRVTSVTGAMVYISPFKIWKNIPFVTL